jgi:hypothetical protein
MQKLKTTEIAKCRNELLQQQNFTCALCKEALTEDPVLDHDHRTGRLRGALHRGCNALEGVIQNNQARNGFTQARLEVFLSNLLDYRETQIDILHPSHRTPEQKKERAVKRAKKSREAAKKHK